jgi:hypothetical protein
MESILEKDENVKKEIQIRAHCHLENHNYHRQQLIMKTKERFIMDKAYEEFERKIFEELTEESKERDPFVRFIKERVEQVFYNLSLKKIDEDTILSMNKLYPHFKRWFEKTFPTIPVYTYTKARANFLVRIGPFTTSEGWKGYRLKK